MFWWNFFEKTFEVNFFWRQPLLTTIFCWELFKENFFGGNVFTTTIFYTTHCAMSTFLMITIRCHTLQFKLIFFTLMHVLFRNESIMDINYPELLTAFYHYIIYMHKYKKKIIWTKKKNQVPQRGIEPGSAHNSQKQ